MSSVPTGYLLAHPGLTASEYQLVAARLLRELPAIRFHGEPIAGPSTAPNVPAFALWVDPADAGSRVELLVIETVSR
ncbi:MAG: hypothetical protein K8U57_11160 [Planctomycetes bacterium]|nr:hypothetical protein [Planctomycetota bacterium]